MGWVQPEIHAHANRNGQAIVKMGRCGCRLKNTPAAWRETMAANPSSRRAFPRGNLPAVPPKIQDEGDEEPGGAGSTPGSPAPTLVPAST